MAKAGKDRLGRGTRCLVGSGEVTMEVSDFHLDRPWKGHGISVWLEERDAIQKRLVVGGR